MADTDSRLPIRQIHVRATTPDDDDLTIRQTGIQGTADDTIHSADISLFDENGDAFTADNPLPVAISEFEGSEVVDYNTTASLAKDATADHDYTVTALMKFVGSRVWVCGSGRTRAIVRLETAPASGTYNDIFVGFNSTAFPNIDIPLDKITSQVAGAIVRISITNFDNQAFDVYSTLVGIEKTA